MQQEEIVSIGILTFNHEKFIRQTLKSVLCQNCTFEFKIYVLDDYSSDNTFLILKQFSLKYPDKITIIQNEKNIGVIKSAIKLAQLFKGKYCVLFDGDDYWSNENKLKTQVEFLENNHDFVASCHDVQIVSILNETCDNAIIKSQNKSFYKTISQFTRYEGNIIEPYQLLQGNTYIQGCSLIWRRFELHNYINKLNHVKFNLDWYFTVILSTKGKINYIKESWAVYVDHSNGETKNNYFHDYFSDKIILLKSLFDFNFYNQLYFRYMIYELISKEYYSLIISKSKFKKTHWFLLVCTINYVRFSSLKTIWFLFYVIKYRNKF